MCLEPNGNQWNLVSNTNTDLRTASHFRHGARRVLTVLFARPRLEFGSSGRDSDLLALRKFCDTTPSLYDVDTLMYRCHVSIPAWPKIHQLDNWKMQLLMNVLSARADPDTDAWTKWLEQALGLNPDLNMLSDSGGDRFATIDIKMAMGMQNMLKQAPDEAKDVYLDATRHSELRHQQTRGDREGTRVGGIGYAIIQNF